MVFARLAAMRLQPAGIVARTTATKIATKPAAPFMNKAPFMMATRNFAYTSPPPSYPKTLAVRIDGLMAQCLVAAIIYFAPQDIIFLGGVLAYWRACSNSVNPKTWATDPEAAVEAFKAQKGLDTVNLSKGGTWKVSLR